LVEIDILLIPVLLKRGSSQNTEFKNLKHKERCSMNKIKHPQFGKSVFMIMLSTLLVLGLIFASWGTVYASQKSIPGDLLYSAKLSLEDLQLTFTSDTPARIRLLTDLTDHRAEEAAILALQGQPIPAELSTMIAGYIKEIIVLTANMDEGTQQEILEGVQRHLRPRDQDQGMTGPINSPIHDDNNPPPRDMNKNGKGQDSTNISVEILNIDSTFEISSTQIITTGTYGPGPCQMTDCASPLADEHSPGPHLGIDPGPENYEGYGPGFGQDQGSQQTATSSSNGKSDTKQGQGNQP